MNVLVGFVGTLEVQGKLMEYSWILACGQKISWTVERRGRKKIGIAHERSNQPAVNMSFTLAARRIYLECQSAVLGDCRNCVKHKNYPNIFEVLNSLNILETEYIS